METGTTHIQVQDKILLLTVAGSIHLFYSRSLQLIVSQPFKTNDRNSKPDKIVLAVCKKEIVHHNNFQ